MSALISSVAKSAVSKAFHAHHRTYFKNAVLNSICIVNSRRSALPASHIFGSSYATTTKYEEKKNAQWLYVKTPRMHGAVNFPFTLSPTFLYTESLGFQHPVRSLHSSPVRLESKVGETLEAIKDTIKKDAPSDKSKSTSEQLGEKQSSTHISPASGQSNVRLVSVPDNAYPSQVKEVLPLRTRIVNELKHYYHGFRLLFIDLRVSLRLIWAVLNGKSLMRRERKQLVRTTADLFRLVPFLVFIIVPFAEFLLPVVLKFFPGMLPSTFQEADKEQEKVRKNLKMKLEMAKFLQDTIEETALQRKDGKGESVHDFVDFMSKIRTSGGQTSNEDILKFSKLFEDDITLDNLNQAQLRAMCQLLEITPVGPNYILRFQLEMKLRELEADDKMIKREGVDAMAVWELQEACRQRGMRSLGVPEERLQMQLMQWLDLHLNMKIPTSLLLLSRTLYFPEHISTEDQLKATILTLPETMTDEAKVKISEVSGDRVDNKSKLEVIKQEEELILKEKQEFEQASAKEEEEAKADLSAIPIKSEKVLVDQMPSLDHIIEKEEEKFFTKDLEHLEDALDMIVESKQKLKAEVEDLKSLKEEFSEYKENLDQLKGMMAPEVPLAEFQESKAAQRLSKKVEQMISKLDTTVAQLSADQPAQTPETKAPHSVEAADFRIGDNVPDLSAKELSTLITITELLNALEKVQSKSQASSKFEIVAKVLDADQDGLIDYNEALKFVELLGQENLNIDSEKMSKIVKLLKKEQEVLEGEKQKKQQEQQQAYRVPNIPLQPVSTQVPDASPETLLQKSVEGTTPSDSTTKTTTPCIGHQATSTTSGSQPKNQL